MAASPHSRESPLWKGSQVSRFANSFFFRSRAALNLKRRLQSAATTNADTPSGGSMIRLGRIVAPAVFAALALACSESPTSPAAIRGPQNLIDISAIVD